MLKTVAVRDEHFLYAEATDGLLFTFRFLFRYSRNWSRSLPDLIPDLSENMVVSSRMMEDLLEPTTLLTKAEAGDDGTHMLSELKEEKEARLSDQVILKLLLLAGVEDEDDGAKLL